MNRILVDAEGFGYFDARHLLDLVHDKYVSLGLRHTRKPMVEPSQSRALLESFSGTAP